MKRNHSKENTRLGKIVFFVCVVLSVFAVTFCRSQIVRVNDKYVGHPEIKTLFPEEAIHLNYKGGDISIGAYVDSVSLDKRFMFIYAYYPKSININSKITIGFNNGLYAELSMYEADTTDANVNYVEYMITDRYWYGFVELDYTYINIPGAKQFISVVPSKYFSDFFSKVVPIKM